MHELSIATSILELAQKHVPAGAVLQRVDVRAGELRGIEPHAMEFAWRACTLGIPAEGSKLNLDVVAGDELRLVSIEVDTLVPAQGARHESRNRRKRFEAE